MIRPSFALLAAALLATASAGGVAGARAQEQAARAPTRVPATVVLVDQLPHPGTPFQLLRRAGTAPHDVILLPATADAALFSDAVRALLIARRADGDRTARDAVLRTRTPATAPDRRPAVLPWAERVLRDLRGATPRAVEGVGAVPAVEIWLPAQAARGPAR